MSKAPPVGGTWACTKPYEAVIGSAVRRFRPIVVTAAAAILALIPLLADPFWGPMAYAMMGGLALATVPTVLFVPAPYAACFRVRPPPAAPPPV